MEDRRIAIAIPTFNRSEMTIDAFIDVYNDERVGEIIIVDDASDIEIYNQLKSIADKLPKVKLFRNIFNKDCYFNKLTAVSYASLDWVVLLDSDNKIDTSYIDIIYELHWQDQCIYTPSFAKPSFDFRAYEGLTIARHNVAQYVDKPMFEVCLNAANYFVNKNKYCENWTNEIDPVTSDSIFVAKRWLERGGEIFIVPNLNYEHRVWNESHWQNNNHRTPAGFHQDILNQLKQLK